MKKFIFALVMLFTITVSASAMSYSQARDQALFLTDKMAYELNLTDEQYEAAYEINLDYLMRIDNYDDLYGVYWRQRNLDLSYILLDWQYNAYCAASYFYRPLYWDGGYWHFGIYARYPHRDYFYFGCPNFVFTYTGGHSWYMNGGRSWYYGRRWVGPRDFGPHPGMRVRFDDGRYGNGYRYEPGRRTWTSAPGNMPQRGNTQQVGNRTFGNLQRGGVNDSPLRNRTFGSGSTRPSTNGTRSTVNMPSESSNRTFGNRFSSGDSQPARSFSPSTRSTSQPSRSFGGSFGSRNAGGSFGGHSAGSSFGGRSTGGSFGGGNSGNSGSSAGGGHFGRR